MRLVWDVGDQCAHDINVENVHLCKFPNVLLFHFELIIQ